MVNKVTLLGFTGEIAPSAHPLDPPLAGEVFGGLKVSLFFLVGSSATAQLR